MSDLKKFPYASEIVIPPELAGWEEMYPSIRLFSKDRLEWDNNHLWFQDKIHAPEALYPLDDIFQEAWQIALSANNTRVFCIPPAQGIAHRILGCYMYISPVEPPAEATIGEKAGLFGKRVPYVFQNYPMLWDKWMVKFEKLGREMQALKVHTELPKYCPDEDVIPVVKGYTPAYEVIESFNTLISMIFKLWHYHFEYLNLAYLAYLMFVDTATKLFPGIKESTVGKMCAGADVAMFRPEEELCRLARLAVAQPVVKDIMKKDIPADEKKKQLEATEAGKAWLKEIEKVRDPWFFVSCGSGWFHHEGSWTTKREVPYSYLKSYIERLEKGETIERNLSEISDERDRIIAEYQKLIKSDEDRKTFMDAYNTVRTIYKYAEDHLFWVEHWAHTIWFEKVRNFGTLLVNQKLLKNVDDIFLFNRFEVPELIEDLVTQWALGEGVPSKSKVWMEKAEKREKILAAARKWSPPLALGTPPEVIVDAFILMLWGINSGIVADWLKGVSVAGKDVTELKGFASSAGVAEGPARVVRSLDDIVLLKEGEILVAPTTNPSWSPVFTKIKAAVTDIGGLTSHAAIVSREYRLPSVTGTGVGTTAIKTGDTIKVDGTAGTVTIVKRAG